MSTESSAVSDLVQRLHSRRMSTDADDQYLFHPIPTLDAPRGSRGHRSAPSLPVQLFDLSPSALAARQAIMQIPQTGQRSRMRSRSRAWIGIPLAGLVIGVIVGLATQSKPKAVVVAQAPVIAAPAPAPAPAIPTPVIAAVVPAPAPVVAPVADVPPPEVAVPVIAPVAVVTPKHHHAHHHARVASRAPAHAHAPAPARGSMIAAAAPVARPATARPPAGPHRQADDTENPLH